MVPFNTQLLADLIADGVAPTRLSTLSTQAELLNLYWQRRVQAFTPEGDACLRAVLEEMVTSRSLRASQQTAFASGGNGLARLLGAGVLVEQSGGRNVAFRHHILFDYAASRLYLNPFDAAGVHSAFVRENGLGLMLGPALGYALQELWNSNPDRRDYWNMVAGLIGDRAIDPIARSIAARSCSELPAVHKDTDGLIEQLSKDEVGRAIFGAIIGSLALWDEDHSGSLIMAPWTEVGVAASKIPDLVGSISFLLGILMKQPSAGEHRDELGVAARNLLAAALARKGDAYSADLAAAGIRFVAETYGSDVEASRALLSQVFSVDRFETYAHAEVPALAYQIATIRAIDPEFAIRIYSEVFSRRITSQAFTRMNDSQIMPFMSQASQDYERARFQLAHTFPEFLTSSPMEATKALIRGDRRFHHKSASAPGTAWRLDLQRGWARRAGGRGPQPYLGVGGRRRSSRYCNEPGSDSCGMAALGVSGTSARGRSSCSWQKIALRSFGRAFSWSELSGLRSSAIFSGSWPLRSRCCYRGTCGRMPLT